MLASERKQFQGVPPFPQGNGLGVATEANSGWWYAECAGIGGNNQPRPTAYRYCPSTLLREPYRASIRREIDSI